MSKIIMLPLKEGVVFKSLEYKVSNLYITDNNKTIVKLRGFIKRPHWFKLADRLIGSTNAINDFMVTVLPSKVITTPAYHDSYGLIISAEGVSRLNEGDIYDRKFGIQLAESRAKYKIYQYMFMLTNKVMQDFIKIIGVKEDPLVVHSNTLNSDYFKFKKLMENEKKHIEYLLNSRV